MDKYLLRYAEKEAGLTRTLFTRTEKNYQHVLCIPAFDENLEDLETLIETTFNTGSLLLVLIINEPSITERQSPIAQQHIGNLDIARHRTRQVAETLKQTYPCLDTIDHLSLHKVSAQTELLLISALGKHALPYEKGVGLARKIANDCAATLIHMGKITCPVLFNSDADATLPYDYFAAVTPQNHIAAWLYPFEHGKDAAAALYQVSLDHYVSGLAHAGSPYAFHTVGSCIAIHYPAYRKVRGFPKRNAAEDFYLLNKLAKLASIENLKSPTLQLSTRRSHRVPFGTGPKLIDLDSLDQIEQAELFHHPACFDYLRAFILFHQDRRHDNINTFIQNEAPTLDMRILDTLLQDFSPGTGRYFHQEFDALKTLQLIHYLGQQHFPKLSWQALSSLANQ